MRACLTLLAWLAASQAGAASIERLDARLDALLRPDAAVERLVDGLHWVEGPAWNPEGGYLLFSDIPANIIYRWQRGSGLSIFLTPSGYSGDSRYPGREPGSNGLAFDAGGRLLICEHGNRRLTRLDADGRRTVLADRFRGLRLNSPNDVVTRSNGDLYFTDPPFGLPRAFEDGARELPFSGVYRLSTDGELQLLIDDVKAPNGIAFSPDETTLYVSDVDPARSAWLAYAIAADGSVRDGSVLFDATALSGPDKGAPDGIKVDRHGNVFGAGPGGVFVLSPAGELLGFIDLGVPTANLAWGEDGSALYITASTAIYRVPTLTRGANYRGDQR